MKEHVLSDSDRAALQSLIPLAGALGAGTIFALFFGGRKRRAELAVFEIFAVAAVFACVATTAYFAIALLHQNQPIGNRDLTQTAAPLLIAAFLLIFISAFGRLGGSTERIVTLLPLVAVGIFVAFGLSALSWEVEPADTVEIAAAIIAVGIVFSLLAGVLWRLVSGRERRRLQGRFAELSRRGYRSEQRALLPGLPIEDPSRSVLLAGWARKGRFYIDAAAARRLQRLVRDGWDERSQGLHRPALGTDVLLDCAAPTAWRELRGEHDLRLALLGAGDGKERVELLERVEKLLYDVTELVGPGSASAA